MTSLSVWICENGLGIVIYISFFLHQDLYSLKFQCIVILLAQYMCFNVLFCDGLSIAVVTFRQS